MNPHTTTKFGTLMPEDDSPVRVQSAHELWLLSRQAIANDQVRAIIDSCDSWQIPAVLNATFAGRELLAELDLYDERYGRRGDDSTLLGQRWTDDPTPVIESLRDLMRRPDCEAPAASSRLAA